MKLHLGCGEINIPGFTNIDLSAFPHIDMVADISSLPQLDSECAHLIYVSATFQYFDRDVGERCLREWHRLLQPGACLMISTVNFDKLIEVYKKTGEMSTILGPLYGKMGVWNQNGSVTDKIYHKTVYDIKDLKRLLKECGFTGIEEYDFKETIHRDYDDQSQAFYPPMDKENGIHIMQNLKAYKGRKSEL